MPQPPATDLIADQLDRARRVLGDQAADQAAHLVATYWRITADYAHNQAQWAALGLLLQAAHMRQQDDPLADVIAGCAEACVLGWRDELVVQLAKLELASVSGITTTSTAGHCHCHCQT